MKAASLYLFIFISFYNYSQVDLVNLVAENEVTTITYWEVGDNFEYHIVEEKKVYHDGHTKPSRSTRDEFDIEITVLEGTATNYKLRLDYSLPEIESNDNSELLIWRTMNEISVEYVTDEFGTVDSISNIEEIHRDMKIIFEELIENFDKNSDDHVNVTRLIAQLFLNKGNLQTLLLKDVLLIHSLYGVGVEKGSPIEFEVEYFPINDNVLLGEGVVELNSIQAENDLCEFTMTQIPYDELMEEFVVDLAKVMLPNKLQEIDLTDISMNMSTETKYEMQLSSGTMVKVENQKNIHVIVDDVNVRSVEISTATLK